MKIIIDIFLFQMIYTVILDSVMKKMLTFRSTNTRESVTGSPIKVLIGRCFLRPRGLVAKTVWMQD